MCTNAVAVVKGQVHGTVTFHQCAGRRGTEINIDLSGFRPNSVHGLHIHEYGTVEDGCNSLGGHFNPYHRWHGSYLIDGDHRHAGDLINNVFPDSDGDVNVTFYDHLVSLKAPHSVIGRSIVVHSHADDLGIGKEKCSRTTGCAGKRIACGRIERVY